MASCNGRGSLPPVRLLRWILFSEYLVLAFTLALCRCALALSCRRSQSDQSRGHFSADASAVRRGDRADDRSDGGADRSLGDLDHGDGLCGRRVDHVGAKAGISPAARSRRWRDRRFHRHRARDRRVERRLHGLFRHAFVSRDADHHDVLQRLGNLVHRRSHEFRIEHRRLPPRFSRSALAAWPAFPTPRSSPS